MALKLPEAYTGTSLAFHHIEMHLPWYRVLPNTSQGCRHVHGAKLVDF